MPYDKSKPYSCPCCGYWNSDMKYDYYKHKKPITDQDIISSLQFENTYLKGVIEVYEKFLKDRGYIKEEECLDTN